ncbi:hypothetical protein K0M31_014074, partial [Melipona bicolor]
DRKRSKLRVLHCGFNKPLYITAIPSRAINYEQKAGEFTVRFAVPETAVLPSRPSQIFATLSSLSEQLRETTVATPWL